MRCFICNVAIEKPQFNSEHDDFDPCETCKQVIADTVAGYEDVVAADEDEFGDEPVPFLVGYFPDNSHPIIEWEDDEDLYD